LIEPCHAELSVRQSELQGLNRSTLYYEPAVETPENLALMQLIDEEYTRHPFKGSRRIAVWLSEQTGREMNRKRVQRLMGVMGLEAVYPKPDVDVWAVAASLYYMLTLQPPRQFGPGRDAWQVVLDTDAVPIRERNPAIPTRLAKVIDEALIDNPEIRFKTASELSAALKETL
jgi:serine/threonine protein kinase